MEQTKAKLESLLLNKPLTDIEIYNISKNYFEVKPEHSWIFNGAIELRFGNEIFCLAWDYQNGSFDYSIENGVDNFLDGMDYSPVDVKAIKDISELIGQSIQDIQFEWEFYQEFDDEGQIKEEKFYVPIGLKMTFTNDSVLQLAAIETQLKSETMELVNTRYNLAGDLLVSVNNDIEISFPES